MLFVDDITMKDKYFKISLKAKNLFSVIIILGRPLFSKWTFHVIQRRTLFHNLLEL